MSAATKVYESYFGGKEASGVPQQIINCIRPHDIYMELFLGNGAVFRYKKRAQRNILNYLNGEVYVNWVNNFKAAHKDNVDILNRCAVDFLRNYQFSPLLRYCVYLDPPYPLDSRRSSKKVYPNEMTDEDHAELLRVITALPGNVDVLISTYENPMYAEALKDWRLIMFQAKTRQGVAIEHLYMNYAPSGELHEYTYLGKNNTDRQRIKRKISREVAKLQGLPAEERNAIIQAVLQLGTG